MKFHYSIFLLFILNFSYAENLLDVRKGFVTTLLKKEKLEEPMDVPPEDVFKIVKFDTELGKMGAYLSVHDLKEGDKRPAIVWLTGGLPVARASDYLWTEVNYENEQSARTFRQHGIISMFPTLRGRKKGNPGHVESFFGEVNDVISAAKYLKSLPYIDSKRIYLGGHSSGGTLALLVGAATDMFAGVISLGPTNNHYGQGNAPYKWEKKEIYLRSPENFVSMMQSPTYIIEGVKENSSSLLALKAKAKKVDNKKVNVEFVESADHFTCIHPVNRLFAKAILASKDGALAIDMKKEIVPSVVKYSRMIQEAEDLRILRKLRFEDVEISGLKTMTSTFYSWEKEALELLAGDLEEIYFFKPEKITTLKNQDGKTYFGVSVKKAVDFSILKNVFEASFNLRDASSVYKIYYDYWGIE